MADIITLGIQIALSDIDKATKALDKLADASVGVEKATSGINKATKETAKTQEEAANKASLQAQREARAQRAVEQALLAKEKTVTQAAKTSAITAAAEIKAQNALQANIRAQARLQEGVARASAESAKRLDVLASKQGAQAALTAKYTSQTQAIQERAGAYALNQQSLVENRTLATQARITAGAQRQALMQEKFEFQKAQAAERAARRQADSVGILKGAYQSVRDIAIGAFAVGGVAGGVSSIIRTADTLTLLDSRLKLATKSQEDFVKTQTALRESSLRTGLNLEAQISGYTQLERSTRALGLSSNQLTFLTESFGKAAIVSGADAASYQSALTQLNQGFASGVIRGQEFNSVAEQAPAIMEALANGLRGSNKEFDDLEKKGFIGVAALRKLAGEGKLVNSVTIPALIEGLKVTNQQFDSLPLTVQRATEKLKTAYQIWISDQNNASGATKALAESIQLVSANFGGLVNALTTGALVIATVLGGRLVAGLASATAATKTWQVVTGEASRTNVAAAKTAVESALAQEAEARAKLKNAANTRAATAAQLELSAATTNLIGKAAAYDKALASTALSQRALTTASSAFSGTLALLGGPIGIAITGLTLLIAYWDDLKVAILGATSAHADFMKTQARISSANTGVDITKAIQDQVKHTKELIAQRDILNNKLKTTADYVNPRTGDVDQSRINRDRQQVGLLNEQIRESSLQEQTLEITRRQRNANVTESVLSSLVKPSISGPTPDTKVKAPKALGAGESELTAIKGRVAAYEEELKLVSALGTAKDNLNEHEVRAYQIQEKIKALDPAAKNYAELKSNLELTLAQERRAGVLKKEIDAIQERNKAVIDWRKEVEKLTEKQENLAKYTAVSLDSKAETSQELAARRIRENYEAALQTLKGIDAVLNAPEGVDNGEKRRGLEKALGVAPAKQESSFQEQIAGFDTAVDFAQQNGDLDLVRQLEEKRTAIVEAEAAKRKAIQDEENQSIQNNLTLMQNSTDSILSILKSAGQEQTGIYRALFAVNKAFAIANSIIKIQQGIAEAASLPFPLNLPAMATVVASTAGIVSTISSTDAKFAKGAAFDGPVGAGSGVISTPTTFPMSGGKTGMLGERAGEPEGILPLTRDANGRLGVTALGGGGGSSSVQQNNITINVSGGNTNEETAGVVSRELLKTMERIADSRISNATRPTGILAR